MMNPNVSSAAPLTMTPGGGSSSLHDKRVLVLLVIAVMVGSLTPVRML